MANIVAATETDLMKLDGEGKALWSHNVAGENRNRVLGVTAIADGGLIYGWSISYPYGGLRPSVWSIHGDGSGQTELEAGFDLQMVGPLAANVAGDVAWVVNGAGERKLEVRRDRGGDLSIRPAAESGLSFRVPGLDDGGHVLAAAYAQEAVQFGATRVEAGHSLMRFNADGSADWATSIGSEAQGSFEAISTTSIGTVVAFGRFTGRIVWGSSTFDVSGDEPRYFVLVAEANGAPRFAIELPNADRADGSASMGLDPSGRLAVAWRTPDGAARVRFYNLIGQQLWERTFTGDVTPTGVAFLGHDVVVAGRFTGSADFGSGHEVAQDDDGFLVRFAP